MSVELLLTGIIGVTVGIVSCFFGWQVFKLVLVLWGFLIGAMIGVSLASASSADISTIAVLIVGLITGLVGAGLALVLYVVGIFLAGAVFGVGLSVSLLTALVDNPSTLLTLIVVIISAVFFGVLATRLNKWFIIVATALGGAASIVTGALMLFNQERFILSNDSLRFVSGFSTIEVIIVLVIAAIGAIFQFSRSIGDKTG